MKLAACLAALILSFNTIIEFIVCMLHLLMEAVIGCEGEHNMHSALSHHVAS